MIQKTYSVFFIWVLVTLVGCKSSKSIIASGKASHRVSSKQVIKQHQNSSLDFDTLKARVKIGITNNDKTQSAGFTIRIEKDKVIWLNESLLRIARMIITPEKVRFFLLHCLAQADCCVNIAFICDVF